MNGSKLSRMEIITLRWKRWLPFLTLLVPLWTGAAHSLTNANASATNRVLIIGRSSTTVSGAKATLSIGPLQRQTNIYSGDYQIKVSPYFYKGEKGRLAIVVSDESLAKVSRGVAVEIKGTATTNGKGGETRRIDATATPADRTHGALKLWFISGDRKMVFNTSYHLVEE